MKICPNNIGSIHSQMIGIGTDAVAINSHQHRFASFLGLDDQSWGFSFRGQIQHNKRMKYYGRKFSRGCLVGVYLDRHIGVLKFYVNRRLDDLNHLFFCKVH